MKVDIILFLLLFLLLSSISWWRKSLLSWCVLLFSANTLLSAINCDQMCGLQNVQNHAAKVVSRKNRHERTRPLLKALHWLPFKERINLNIATFTFRFFDCAVPPYGVSSCLCPVYTSARTLFRWKVFLVQNGNLRALVTGRSRFRLPLSGRTFLLISDTAVLYPQFLSCS